MDQSASYPKMTAAEFNATAQQLSKIYDVVRAVDVSKQEVIEFQDDGECTIHGNHCFETWNKSGRCKNCVSGMAFREKNRLSKFEFVGHDVFHVTAQYVTIDDKPYVMEIVEKDSDASLVGAFGKNQFVDKIKHYTDQVYTDSLTQVGNRRYFDEQLSALEMDAVVMIDVDNFKSVNDTKGHICGDRALQAVAQAIRNNVRNEDSVVRYGGDEFLIAFSVIDASCIEERMEEIRKAVEAAEISQYEDVNVSISIGVAAGRGKVSDLILLADEELYRAKQTRNSISIKCF